MYIYDPVTDRCHLIYNPPVNIPNGVITSDIKQVSLPNKSNFGNIDPIIVLNRHYMEFGELLYAKNTFNTAGCSALNDNGDYDNVLGTFPDGSQAWYAGHIQLDENTLSNPIADGGAAMMNLYITQYDDWAQDPQCPVASKSFVNRKYK